MNRSGLILASRYAYPPNSLSLCGPDKQRDLQWYAGTTAVDRGTEDVLSQFGTLYPYLRLIAAENRIADPFDPRVVESYWLGNPLLRTVHLKSFMTHLVDDLDLGRKLPRPVIRTVAAAIEHGGLPFHNFHVLAVYRRTGHLPDTHTIQTMDACSINFGTVTAVRPARILVETRPLIRTATGLAYAGKAITRSLRTQGRRDAVAQDVKPGDIVSYHWGYLCDILSPRRLRNLKHYTSLTLRVVNSRIWPDSSVFSEMR